MRAIRIHAPGGPEVLREEELPTPSPGPGEALVKIEAVGVNYVDIYQREGLYRMSHPFTAGSEAAGVVEAVGDGSRTSAPGTASPTPGCSVPTPPTLSSRRDVSSGSRRGWRAGWRRRSCSRA